MEKLTRKSLLISCSVLAGLSLASFITYVVTSDQGRLKDVSLNLGTEILGILLTVALIDRVIRSNEKAERERYRAIAIKQLRIPLLHHLDVLLNIFKASIQSPPEKSYANVSELFDDDYFSQIGLLDFAKQAPVMGGIQWFEYLSYEFSKFKDGLGRTIEKYAPYLDSDSIDLMEQILNSSFLAYILQVPAIRATDQNVGFKRAYNMLFGVQEMVVEYTDLFSQLVETYNRCAAEDKRLLVHDYFWSNNTAPLIGSGRIDMSGRGDR